MNDPLRRFVSLLLLVATFASLPGSASACPCGPRRAATMSSECPRCRDAEAPASTPQLKRANCCRTAATDAAAAFTPASLQFDHASCVAFEQAAAAASHAIVVADARAARAPPGFHARSANPPDPHRSSILRL